jgi:hypothetical protein
MKGPVLGLQADYCLPANSILLKIVSRVSRTQRKSRARP